MRYYIISTYLGFKGHLTFGLRGPEIEDITIFLKVATVSHIQ
jgi:hypothetical protein